MTKSHYLFIGQGLVLKTLISFLLVSSPVVQNSFGRELSENKITNLAPNVICGKQLTRKPKVIGGEETYQGEFPWLVSIKEKIGNNFSHICGGFIANNRYIISAGHCYEKFFSEGSHVIRLNQLKVTIGEHDLAHDEFPRNAFDVGIEKLTIHPNFSIYGYINDIAIVKLEKAIEWSPYSWPACLSSKTFEPKDGTNGTVAGWGSTVDIIGDQMGEYPNLLKKANIPILSNRECQKWFHRKSVHWNPRDSHICAGYPEGGKDACRGDSGSPFLIQDGEDFIVIGIVAAGKGCGRPSLPGVYTRLNRYLDWIEQEISST